jgi:hypothetical protein
MEHLIADAIINGPSYFLDLFPWLLPWGVIAAVLLILLLWVRTLIKDPPRKK